MMGRGRGKVVKGCVLMESMIYKVMWGFVWKTKYFTMRVYFKNGR